MKVQIQKPDTVLLVATLVLLSIGIVMVFSASCGIASIQYNNPHLFLKFHLIRVAIGFIAMFLFYKLDYHYLKLGINFVLILGIILLVITLIPALSGQTDPNRAKRWIIIHDISFQPSELVKLALIIFLAFRISEIKGKIKEFTTGLIPLLLPVALIITLIIRQPNYSEVIAISFIVFFMIFIAGADWKHILALGVIEVLLVAVILVSREYSLERLTTFFGQGDPLNEAYQTNQSLIALGSGSMFGVGIGNSWQKMFYLPVAHTDFLLAIIGEELGFVGTMAVMVGFLVFCWRGIKIALRARDKLGFLIANGITAFIFVHFAINVGVVTDLLPNTGIPLPFMSYGGTFLLFSMMGVGILLNISTQLQCSLNDDVETAVQEKLVTQARQLALNRQKISFQVSEPLQRRIKNNEIHNRRWRNRRTFSPST
ncbi:putative lipid II flippase FtsW [bacterium]|nr:putative lipid II flippase FtsW [bacterium]